MMLTESQKRELNKFNVYKLLHYVHDGLINFPADFVYVDEIKIGQLKELLKTPRMIDDFKGINFKDLRDELYNKLKDRPFDCEGIPCFVRASFDISKSDSYCLKCGHRMIDLIVSSPWEYWVHLCGREYRFSMCSHCGEKRDLELLIMS